MVSSTPSPVWAIGRAATDPGLFVREYGGHIPESILRTVVPAAPDAWITALGRFGTMTFGEVAAAAIRFADEGFPMYPLLADMIAVRKAKYARWSSSAEIYLPGGQPPKVGEMFVQKDLARTLRYMVDEEAAAGGDRLAGLKAARDAFYCGDIARTIVDFHRQEGGWLSANDLADFHSPIERARPRCASVEPTSIPVVRGARGRCWARRSTSSIHRR